MLRYLIVVITLVVAPSVGAAQEDPEYILTHKQTKEKKQNAPCDCCGRCVIESKDGKKPKCKSQPKKPKKKPSPWSFKLRFGSLAQLNSNRGVIGQRDGTTRSIGGEVNAQANYTKHKQEIRNRLDINVVFVKTPNTSGWVSSTDVFELETIYQYRLQSWMGPFARAALNTSLFIGRDLRANSVQYQLPDGTLTGERTEFRLTDPFRPITLMQSLGLFINPIRKKFFDLDFRAGFGMREIFAQGQLGVVDDEMTTDIVELVELKDFVQAGAELIFMARGQLYDKKINYHVGGEFLLPILRTKEAGDERSSTELLNKRFRLGVSYRVASWATLIYEIRLVHQPQLSERYQVQNSFGFKASYSVL